MNAGAYSEVAYRLGRDVLGPPLLSFVRLLLSAAEEDRITKLSFVARDGEFLMRATEAVIAQDKNTYATELGYLHLSRISTALPGEARFDQASVLKAAEVRAGTPTMAHLLAYYGLDSTAYAAELERYGIREETPLTFALMAPLLSDARFQDRIQADRMVQRELLGNYLQQEGVIGQPDTALVDIGWRGAICNSLQTAFGGPACAPLHQAYYLGYWHESGCHALPGMKIRGLLADFRRSSSPREGAARYLAFPLEALCRANHGTVIGYRRTSAGAVEPVLAEPWDVQPGPTRSEIRRGILDHIRTHADRARISNPEEAARLRRDAQHRLFRLAFFPKDWEVACLRGLTHSEGHVTDWQREIIDPHPVPPWRSPRRWLAGLASPWRAGYVMASGGAIFAALFVATESILLRLPTAWRDILQKWARRRARLR